MALRYIVIAVETEDETRLTIQTKRGKPIQAAIEKMDEAEFMGLNPVLLHRQMQATLDEANLPSV